MLLLFDIDGTLVLKGTSAHARAMRAAMSEVHGIPEPEPAGIQSAGRTDGEIARLILTQMGVPAARIDEHADDVRRVSCERYAELVEDDLAGRVPRGMDALLAELAAGEDVILALVTGNYEAIARMKLRAAGIGHHFPSGQGGFGSDHEDRTELPAIARARAGGEEAYARERTLVIGDTPRDIACARADGVGVIAMTTGPHRAGELRDADAVARSTAELRTALGAFSAR